MKDNDESQFNLISTIPGIRLYMKTVYEIGCFEKMGEQEGTDTGLTECFPDVTIYDDTEGLFLLLS